jgi:outer membrane protein assembly factor BamB
MINRRRLLILTFASVVLFLAVIATIRLDGFHDNGQPQWRWVWQEKPEERSLRVVFKGVDEHGNPIIVKELLTAAESADRQRQTADALRKFESAVDEFHASRGGMAPIELRISKDDCTEYRGADHAGVFSGLNWSRDWKSKPPRIVWKQPIGGGWSSFIVVGDFAFTHEQRGDDEAVVCYEWRTGVQRWIHRARCRFNEHWTGDGPRATPTYFDGSVYAFGANGRVCRLDARTGELIWQRETIPNPLATNALFGMVGSPLVVDDKVIVCPGQTGASVVALDQKRGEVVWSAGDAEAAYSSPIVAELAGRRQLLNFNAEGLYAHDLKSGAELWNVLWITNPPEMNNVCQPIVLPSSFEPGKSFVFISSGYGVGCGQFEIKKEGERFVPVERWRNKTIKSKFSCCVMKFPHVFGLDDGILTCIDVRTGKRQWKDGRYGFGQLSLVDEFLLVLSERGELVLLEANPAKHVELGRIAVLPKHSWAHPTPFRNHILIRNHVEAALVEVPTQKVNR